MIGQDLRQAIERVANSEVPPTGRERAIDESVRYLASDQAMRSLEANVYWPKWDSPWWHMTLLREMGEAARIPERAVQAMVGALNASPLKIFPVRTEDVPPGTDLFLGSHCHCALGNIDQALSAKGIRIETVFPWIRDWYSRYQLPDGGLNCDEKAYLASDQPSSLVATVAPLEAVLSRSDGGFTDNEKAFLDRGAACLLGRELMRGSTSPNNAEERLDEADWLEPCFPRFYFYDVLRGLSFILRRAGVRGRILQFEQVEAAVRHLCGRYPDGRIRQSRHSYEGCRTLLLTETGDWIRGQPATTFPLLKEVSRIGEISAYLSREWVDACRRLLALESQGRIK